MTDARVWAEDKVKQERLEEICENTSLVSLSLQWPTLATSLEPLTKLTNLRMLRLDSPRNIEDFTPIGKLYRLERLEIENAKHLYNLRWMLPLKDRLEVLGLDGSINTTQKLESLDPLDGFTFRKLTMTSTSVADKDLSPLITCRNLKELRCAKAVSTFEGFMALADARPDMQCDWFSPEAWLGRKFKGGPALK